MTPPSPPPEPLSSSLPSVIISSRLPSADVRTKADNEDAVEDLGTHLLPRACTASLHYFARQSRASSRFMTNQPSND